MAILITGKSMTRLPESSSWEEEIELISRSERVAGGLDGPANRPLKSLANRTRYLKDQADTADESIAEKVSAVKTFAEGATLESPREEILFDSYRLVWTGEFPKTVLAGSTPQGTGGIGAGCWAYTSDAVIRQNLGSGEEGLGADLVSANAYHSVREILSRTKTYSDYGKSLPINGYDEDFYASVFANKPEDNDLYLPGKLNIAADLYGTSNNAALLTLLGNNSDSFRAQIVSGDTQTLANYGMTEDLLVYGGIVGKKAIKTTSPTFSADGLTVTDNADLSKVKRGSVIKTEDGYWGKVTSVSGKVISVDGWYQRINGKGIPSGSFAWLNHVDKTYLSNLVLWIPATYTGTKAVGAEWDFMIASPDVTEKNGLDMVIHDASKYDMDTAFYVRSAIAGRAWATGMRVNDFTFAALVTGRGVGDVQAKYDTLFMSGSEYGVQFNGNGGVNVKTSQRWRYSNDSSVYPTNKNRWGFDISGGRISAAAISGTPITLSNMFYYVSNAVPFSLILPSTNLVAGQVIEFGFLGTAAIAVSCASSSITVNGSQTYTFAPLKTWTQGRAVWAGTSWNFYS